jgi:excisionase family DNA binding protein
MSLSFEGFVKEWTDYIVNAVCQKMAVMGANNNIQQQKLYTNKEACKYLNVSLATMQNYRNDGKIAFSQTGRKIMYTQENLTAFLAKNQMEAFNNN